jgi:hypothetical protein
MAADMTTAVEERHDGFITMTVPFRFFLDHSERGLVVHSGDVYVIKATAKTATVRLHPRDAYDLWSDARFYSDTGCVDQDRGLQASARATVNRLKGDFDQHVIEGWRGAGECIVLRTEDWCQICGKKA